jgi:hypothetical protein
MKDHTNATHCDYAGDREDALMSYLYGEDGPAVRIFDAHLATCATCREELDELRGVRGRLAEWAPPEPVEALTTLRRFAPRPKRSLWGALGDMPVWAQVAAASLIVGLSTGLANLDVTYGANGFTIRSGWWPAPASAAAPAPTDAPWRADLAALESELQSEITQVKTASAQSQTAATPTPVDATTTAHDEALLRQVRNLIAQSDSRNQRDLALRVGEVVRDVNTQRRADLVNINRTFGQLQNDMGVELLKQREQLNNYVMQVSSQK